MTQRKTVILSSLFLLISVTGFSQSRTFTGKPIYQILTTRAGTYLGTTTVELFPNIAPLAVANFDSLVNVHFYDTTAFHRVIPGFMIQGGDPNSRHGPIATWGLGDSTQPTVNAEFTAAKHLRGTLSAARDTSINSANSQFFICVAACPWLNGQYSVYGHVTSGMDIVDTIVNSPRDVNDNPFQKIEMFVTYIGSNDSIPLDPALVSPLSGTVVPSSSKTLKWATVSDAIYYHLDVSTDSMFTTLFKSVDYAAIAYSVNSLVAGTTYYWRVRTNNGGHWSNNSPVWNFRITGAGIENLEEKPIITVAPNPSQGQFNFSNLEKNDLIQIYDITGRLVFTEVSKDDHFMVDLMKKDSGIYFYIVTNVKKQVRSGKIILE